MKKIFGFFLRICISVGLLIFLFKFKKIDIKEILTLLSQINPFLFILAFLVFFIDFLLGFLRWRMLLKITKAEFSDKRLFLSYFGSQFFNLFVPSFIGADIMRSIDIGAHLKDVKKVAATVFLDRISGFIGLFLVAIIPLIFGFRQIKVPAVYLTIFILALILIVILFFMFHERTFLKITKHLANRGELQDTIKTLYQEIFYFRSHPKPLMRNILISILIQALLPVVYLLLILALKFKFNPLILFILVPIIGAITAIPISIGGLGVRDNATESLFSKFGLSKNISATVSLVIFLFILIISIFGGIIYVLTFHHRRIQRH